MNHDTPASARVWRLRFLLLVALLIVVPGLIIAYVVLRFGGDTAVVYADPAEHFKYGSTGGEHESGFPYGIFQALPQVCSQQLPGGYRLGFLAATVVAVAGAAASMAVSSPSVHDPVRQRPSEA